MKAMETFQEKFTVSVKVRYKGKKEPVTTTFVLTQEDAKRLQAGSGGAGLAIGGAAAASVSSGKVLQSSVTEG